MRIFCLTPAQRQTPRWRNIYRCAFSTGTTVHHLAGRPREFARGLALIRTLLFVEKFPPDWRMTLPYSALWIGQAGVPGTLLVNTESLTPLIEARLLNPHVIGV